MPGSRDAVRVGDRERLRDGVAGAGRGDRDGRARDRIPARIARRDGDGALLGAGEGIESGAALMVDVAAETAPAPTPTFAVAAIGRRSIVAETTRAPAAVAVRPPVATPSESVTAAGWVMVFPVPVAASTTVAPGSRLPNASRAVTVTMLPVPPAVIAGGTAVMLDSAAETGAGVTATLVVAWSAMPSAVARSSSHRRRSRRSPRSPRRSHRRRPRAARACSPALLAPANTTFAPATGLSLASRTVTVTALVAVPATMLAGAAEISERAAEMPPVVTSKGALVASASPAALAPSA